MALPRKHNLEQLKRLRAITKGKDIGDIVKKGEKKKEEKMPNAYWIDNPLDRKVDTYESFVNGDNKIKMGKKVNEEYGMDDLAFVIFDNYLSTDEAIDMERIDSETVTDNIINANSDKYDPDQLESMRDEILNLVKDYQMEYVGESVHNRGKGPGNNDFYHNSFKQTLTTQLSPSLLQIGKFAKVGKIEGIIDSVDNDFVYITDSDGTHKITFKKFLKSLSLKESIGEDSGLPSEFWTDDNNVDNENEITDFVDFEQTDDIDLDINDPFVDMDVDVDIDDDDDDDDYETHNYSLNPEEQFGEEDDIVSSYDIERDDFSTSHGPRPRISSMSEFGTEDDPIGRRDIEEPYFENIYIDDNKNKVKCDDCGQMVIGDYDSKVAHIYSKHFYKPKLDGSVPVKVDQGRPVTWPYGGEVEKKLVNRYFPKK